MLGVEKEATFDLEHGITKNVFRQTCIIEKFHALSSGLYWTIISTILVHSVVNKKFTSILSYFGIIV